MRLIDADVLKADYGMADDCKNCKTAYRSCDYDRNYSKMDFCGWLDDAPTVDAVPVVHGRWIHRTPNNGHTPPYDECDNCGWEVRIKTNFCPNCGADMRKDGEAHD